MKTNLTRAIVLTTAIAATSLLLTQCTSVKNQSLGPKSEFSNEPFVEAYLEFPGPRRLWAGPQTVILHVTAKDGESPELAVTPAYFQSAPQAPTAGEGEPATIVKRTLSSVQGEEGEESAPQAEAEKTQVLKVGTKMKMPVAAVRDELADIIDSFEDNANVATTGCAFPIRMKLIRQNGGVLEKWGCRGGAAWTKTASEAASRFLASASYLENSPVGHAEKSDSKHADGHDSNTAHDHAH